MNCRERRIIAAKLVFAAVLAYSAQALPASAAPTTFKTGFDDVKAGALPDGWQSGALSGADKAKWHVAADASAPSSPNVLKEDGKGTYLWLVRKDFKADAGSAQTRFKVESGKEDPEAGLIVRFLDGKNYYYVRANILEHDLIFYRMVDGKKEVVKRVETKVTANAWHVLRIEFQKDEFKVTYDGKQIMALKDKALSGAGSVGVWTTADTVADFDDFEATGS